MGRCFCGYNPQGRDGTIFVTCGVKRDGTILVTCGVKRDGTIFVTCGVKRDGTTPVTYGLKREGAIPVVCSLFRKKFLQKYAGYGEIVVNLHAESCGNEFELNSNV